jgi:predicted nucleic acid-binding protein
VLHAYLDSSALLKLVQREAESDALQGFVAPLAGLASSELARIEVLRRARRHGSAAEAKAVRTLGGMTLRAIDEEVIAAAIALDPSALRSLDAIHLATALSLEPLDFFISYDQRLNEAATSAGLTVMAPA